MPRILIVDDAAFVRMRCARALGKQGYEVMEAEDGNDALEKYKEKHPDVVLMDITMPYMDGMSALKKIIEMDPSASVAMVTVLGQQSTIIEALKSGAKDFLVKPLDTSSLVSAVEKLLDNG